MNKNKSSQGLFDLFKWLFGHYPKRMAVTLSGILCAGILEGLSIVALLPLVTVVIDKENSNTTQNTLSKYVDMVFEQLSIEPGLGSLLGFIVMAIILKSMLMFLAITFAGYTTSKITADIRRELSSRIIQSDIALFVKQKSGDITAILINEAQKYGVACMEAIRLLARATEIVIYLLLALVISWKITLGAFLIGLFTIVMLSKIVTLSRAIGKQQNIGVRKFSSSLIDGLGTIKAIKAMRREKHLIKFLKRSIFELEYFQRARIRNDELLRNIQEPIRIVAVAVCLFVITRFWDHGIESLLVLMYLFMKLLSYIGSLQQHYHSLAKFEPAFWSVRDALESIKHNQETFNGRQKPDLHHGIEFKKVNFSYGDVEILKDVDGYIPVNKFIAISGPSGMGKTTFVDIICGLLKVDKGEVFIDDVNLTDIDIGYWRNLIGYVPQDMFFLNDTVRNNITLGDEAISDHDVVDSLQKVGAWSFVSLMENGLDSIVGERGSRLSGGQRQRLSIARAIVKKPKLLILDEVTTSLDKKTEKEICNALKELTSSTTIVAISHQSAILEVADKIFRLDDGKIELKEDIKSLGTFSYEQ